MTRNIAGQLHYDLLADPARIALRPTDPDGLRQAARDLKRSGLRTRDIAAALGIGEHAVEQLLQPSVGEK